MVCIQLAYRKFMAQATDFGRVYLDAEGTSLLDETDVADEIIRTENVIAVLESLKVLRDVERIVITQRYYGDFSFAEIARANNLKLNTALTLRQKYRVICRTFLCKIGGFKCHHVHSRLMKK